jgi:thiamine kinase-like enzyme
VPLPDAYAGAKELADTIERRLGARPLRPCHNDLLSANFIDDGERLWIVDWEYAGMGDPYFDLANFAANHELDADGEAALKAALAEPPADGGLWTGPKVAVRMAARLGRKVRPQRGWDYLRKLGHSLQAPRPRNAKAASAEEQELDKKARRAGG